MMQSNQTQLLTNEWLKINKELCDIADQKFREAVGFYASKYKEFDVVIGISNAVFSEAIDYVKKDQYLFDLITRYPDLFDHLLGTMGISIFLASSSHSFSYPLIKEIGIGALLHDVGFAKLYDAYQVNCFEDLPEGVFNSHVDVGYAMVKDIPGISEMVLKIVLLHHLWDKSEASYDAVRDVFRSYPWEINGQVIPSTAKTLPVGIVQCSSKLDLTMRAGSSVDEALKCIVYDGEEHYGKASILALESIVGNYVYSLPNRRSKNNKRKEEAKK